MILTVICLIDEDQNTLLPWENDEKIMMKWWKDAMFINPSIRWSLLE